jgi:sugar (pentulose or hexulose) kinase
MSQPVPVIAVIDVGKTNKKLFLFDEGYNIVYERSGRFMETVDEDGDPCENLESLRLSVFDSLRSVLAKKEFGLRAVNFSAYGASFVYLDEDGQPLLPLYNYLKAFPGALQDTLYANYGGAACFNLETASPALGSLNSGLQLYRTAQERPETWKRVRHALHLPQYLSYLVSGRACSDITSIGCHTALWDFEKQDYHRWVEAEGIVGKLAPIEAYNSVAPAVFPGSSYVVGPGLHDSSAALIPYMTSFQEPFLLLSTGTWCISLNPFNKTPLTEDELKQDCLCYLHYQGAAVKAARYFAGPVHEEGIARIAAHFHQDPIKYRSLPFDPGMIANLDTEGSKPFVQRDLSCFSSDEAAYHQLMLDIIYAQVRSTRLVLQEGVVKRLFVDGGFSRNAIFMNLLAAAFPGLEVYAASMAQATALGAALAIHGSWNSKPLPNALIHLQYFAVNHEVSASA